MLRFQTTIKFWGENWYKDVIDFILYFERQCVTKWRCPIPPVSLLMIGVLRLATGMLSINRYLDYNFILILSYQNHIWSSWNIKLKMSITQQPWYLSSLSSSCSSMTSVTKMGQFSQFCKWKYMYGHFNVLIFCLKKYRVQVCSSTICSYNYTHYR